MGRVVLWMAPAIAAALAASAALVVDRVWVRPPAPPPPAPAQIERTPPPPPAEPTDPGPARTLVRETLEAAQLSPRHIHHGLYPLRGSGRAADATLDLVSFDCPTVGGCAPLWTAIEARARGAGLQLVASAEADRPGRPMYRALAQAGRPALALRAMPPGPRLVVVVGEVGQSAAVLEALLALPAHVGYAVVPGAPATTQAVDRLVAGAREVLVHLPMGLDEATAPAPGAVTLSQAPEAAAERTLAQIAQLPRAVGVVPWGGDQLTASRRHVAAVLGALRDQGVYFVDPGASAASLAAPAAQTLGVRLATATHTLGADGDDVDARLKAIEAALVLEGHAVVLARPTPTVLVALRRWLPSLSGRGIHLLRVSEIAM